MRIATICPIAFAILVFLPVNLLVAQDEQPGLAAENSPLDVVEQFLGAIVESARLGDVHARFESLNDVVTENHDIDYIGQLAVRRQWQDWDEKQRNAFLASFARLSVMSYASRFANVSEESFEIVGSQSAGGTRIQVNTTVLRADGTQVPLDFVLQPGSDSRWRIANVVADGVSDLALKRAEYRTLLNESGFDGLVQELEAQTDALTRAAGD